MLSLGLCVPAILGFKSRSTPPSPHIYVLRHYIFLGFTFQGLGVRGVVTCTEAQALSTLAIQALISLCPTTWEGLAFLQIIPSGAQGIWSCYG